MMKRSNGYTWKKKRVLEAIEREIVGDLPITTPGLFSRLSTP